MPFDITNAIQDLWPNAPVDLLQGIIDTSDDVFAKTQIDHNRNRVLHFMTQISAESGGGERLHESLYYTSARRLRQVWPSRFRAKSDAELEPLLRDPAALANAVYQGRMGNTEEGDGAKFAGEGLVQTTGRALYKQLGDFIGLDLVSHPELLVAPQTALLCAAGDFVCVCGCLPYADDNNLAAVSGCINVGNPFAKPSQIVGFAERQAWFNRWNEVLPQ